MKKAEQMEVNSKVRKAWDEFKANMGEIKASRPLRSCSASVTTTDRYYILTSYETVIAIIDRSTDTLYDALRMVYGYTATSAKHIAKFAQDYGCLTWGCTHSLRYYDV